VSQRFDGKRSSRLNYGNPVETQIKPKKLYGELNLKHNHGVERLACGKAALQFNRALRWMAHKILELTWSKSA
jgi:hypothetical protein